MSVVVEHLVMAMCGDRLCLGREVTRVQPGEDPVEVAAATVLGSFAHSTSWRWAEGTVVLTFAHVLPDGNPLPDGMTGELLEVADLERNPVACHAVRHLYFLERTDPDVRELPDLDGFWAFAVAVVTHHHPAVAGLLPDSGGIGLDFSI